MSIEAMKLALCALEAGTDSDLIGNARIALRTAIQQAEAQQPATSEPVMDVRCEGCGYMTHHREHMGCVRAAKQHTHPAPSVPADVVLKAKRYEWLRYADLDAAAAKFWPEGNVPEGDAFDSAIDAAMLAAKEAK